MLPIAVLEIVYVDADDAFAIVPSFDDFVIDPLPASGTGTDKDDSQTSRPSVRNPFLIFSSPPFVIVSRSLSEQDGCHKLPYVSYLGGIIIQLVVKTEKVLRAIFTLLGSDKQKRNRYLALAAFWIQL